MSLAFALMAAINGSTGSCATLSHGLQQPTAPSLAGVSPAAEGFSSIMGGGARAARPLRSCGSATAVR
jgi:hypothetical protein